MPRIKKVYTEQFQVYLKPATEKFVREETTRIDVSLSYYIDTLLDMIRAGKLKVKIIRPITNTEKIALARKKRLAARARMQRVREKKQGAPATL